MNYDISLVDFSFCVGLTGCGSGVDGWVGSIVLSNSI